MNNTKLKALEQLNIKLDSEKAKLFENYARIFLEKNSRLNLISKNDEKFLFEKHIFDSLAINLFLKSSWIAASLASLTPRNDIERDCPSLSVIARRHPMGADEAIQKNHTSSTKKTLLDIGTGGGFPSVPISLLYEDLEVFALDSIRKKIKAVEEIKEELNIKNLHPICNRAENLEQKFDFITTRAVSSLDTVLKYAIPHLKKGGYFIAYKSKKATDELKEAERTIKKLNCKLVEIIEYTLPLEENHERNLIIFQIK